MLHPSFEEKETVIDSEFFNAHSLLIYSTPTSPCLSPHHTLWCPSPGFLLYQTFLTVRAHFYPSGSWGKKSARVLSYWYQVQAAQDGAADVIIGKFFEVGYFTANGASPAYKR